MTHASLAHALKLSRPTISRNVKNGMPLDVEGAKLWRAAHVLYRGEKTGPKPKIEYELEEFEGDELRLCLDIASELPGLATNETEREILARAEKHVTEEVRILINTR
jgi:hypothetical protein